MSERERAIAHMRAAFGHHSGTLYAAVSPALVGESMGPVSVEVRMDRDGLVDIVITTLSAPVFGGAAA